MTQVFNLSLATATLADDAKKLGVTSKQLQSIQVTVSITVIQQPIPQLLFTYNIQLPNERLTAQLNWPNWQESNVKFTDFLWENTCLECFIARTHDASSETLSYIELNASPSGRYALYQFESYRYPASQPPPPLLQQDNKARACITWHKTMDKYDRSPAALAKCHSVNPYNLTNCLFIPQHRYQRSFSIPLIQLLAPISNNHAQNRDITHIHPCVILQFAQTLLYYAPSHASPPDFHQRIYWSPFKD